MITNPFTYMNDYNKYINWYFKNLNIDILISIDILIYQYAKYKIVYQLSEIRVNILLLSIIIMINIHKLKCIQIYCNVTHIHDNHIQYHWISYVRRCMRRVKLSAWSLQEKIRRKSCLYLQKGIHWRILWNRLDMEMWYMLCINKSW